MADYYCEDCGHTGPPAKVDDATIVDGVLVTCADCGTTTVQPVAFADAARRKHREEPLICLKPDCDGEVYAETYDGAVRCENGHDLRTIDDRVKQFLDRATSGVDA